MIIDLYIPSVFATLANNKSKEYAVSNYDIKFIDLVYNRECSTGIHFFLTKEEAEHY